MASVVDTNTMENQSQSDMGEMELNLDVHELGEDYKRRAMARNGTFNKNIYIAFLDSKNSNGFISFVFVGKNPKNFFNRIKDDDLEVICDVLSDYTTYVNDLDLSNNEITETGIKHLAGFLRDCSNLISLNLQYNLIGETGGNLLFAALITQRSNNEKDTLEYLNIEGCKIGHAGLLKTTVEEKIYLKKQTLIELFLLNNECIKDLMLGENELDDVCLIEIFVMLNPTLNKCHLRTLSLESVIKRSFSIEIAFEISKVLKINKHLEKLCLRKCSITDEVLTIMLKEANLNDVLKVLDISANLISYKGCFAISDYLKSPYCGLQSLILSSNSVSNLGAQIIARALKTNESLVHLNLNNNGLKEEGILYLANMFEKNTSLVSLSLFWSEFGRIGMQEFWKLIKQNPSNFHFDFGIEFENEEFKIHHLDEQLPEEIYAKKAHYVIN
jgi:Ran GTPase-activating protein (RanGAP) involved in mRNA processing and transport